MAKNEFDDDAEEEAAGPEDLEDEDIDDLEEDDDEDLADDDDDGDGDGDDDSDGDADDATEEGDGAKGAAPARKRRDDEDEDEDEDDEDGDDVEASLDVILKERLVVNNNDDEDDDEEEVVETEDRGEAAPKVLPKQPGEFVCQSCFLVKHPSQLADRDAMLCRDCV